jgi:hypothetical protein
MGQKNAPLGLKHRLKKPLENIAGCESYRQTPIQQSPIQTSLAYRANSQQQDSSRW